MKGWDKARLSEIEAISGPGTLQWTPVRRHFDIAAFGINAYFSADPGQEPRRAPYRGCATARGSLRVITGRATFTLDGEDTDAPAGTIIFIREPAVERSAVAKELGTTVVAIGGRRGVAYTPGPWEPVYVARARGSVGDYEGAISELKRGLEIHREHRCFFTASRAGRHLPGRRTTRSTI